MKRSTARTVDTGSRAEIRWHHVYFTRQGARHRRKLRIWGTCTYHSSMICIKSLTNCVLSHDRPCVSSQRALLCHPKVSCPASLRTESHAPCLLPPPPSYPGDLCDRTRLLARSVDNLFVFLMTFDYFQVPLEHQGRVLTWGIVGAILMRGMYVRTRHRCARSQPSSQAYIHPIASTHHHMYNPAFP